MTPLSPEVFQSLLAIGWIDGDLHPSEAAAVLAAAVDAGLPEDEIERLRAMSTSRVEFGELTTDGLTRAQRLYVYAMASWVARADETVTAVEQAGLHAVATLMGISATGRQTMDEVVEGLSREGHARLDLVGLRARIDAAIRAALG